MPTVTHAFVSTLPDDAVALAAGEVCTQSHWNAQHIVSGVRTLVAGNVTRYVRITGSDSNDGLTPGTAWATTQHAVNVICSTFDFAGFTVTINIGAGTFVGADLLSIIGGGAIFFQGAGRTSTTITDAASTFGCITMNNNGITASLATDQLTLGPLLPGSTGIYVAASGILILGPPAFSGADLGFNGSSSLALVFATAPAVVFVSLGAFHVSGSWQNGWLLNAYPGLQDFGTWTMVGTPSFSTAFANVFTGNYSNNGASYTGAATGKRFDVSGNGTILSTSDPAGTFFPGNAAGTIESGGQYSGVTDYVGSVSGLPATIKGARATVTNATALTFGQAPVNGGSFKVPVYCPDGATWLEG